MTTPVIIGPGEYITRNMQKAIVEFVGAFYAYGYIDDLPLIWDLKTGNVDGGHGNYRFDIVGPWIPKERKRVEAWANVYPTDLFDFFKTQDHAKAAKGSNCIATVRLLEVGPDDHVISNKVWEEARAMVEPYHNRAIYSGDTDKVWSAFCTYSRAFNRLRQEIES